VSKNSEWWNPAETCTTETELDDELDVKFIAIGRFIWLNAPNPI
jgi:hypothetical protein